MRVVTNESLYIIMEQEIKEPFKWYSPPEEYIGGASCHIFDVRNPEGNLTGELIIYLIQNTNDKYYSYGIMIQENMTEDNIRDLIQKSISQFKEDIIRMGGK